MRRPRRRSPPEGQALKPPLASLSHRNWNGTLKLPSYATPATSSHARKLEMIASAAPLSAIGDGSRTCGLAMPREVLTALVRPAERDQTRMRARQPVPDREG